MHLTGDVTGDYTTHNASCDRQTGQVAWGWQSPTVPFHYRGQQLGGLSFSIFPTHTNDQVQLGLYVVPGTVKQSIELVGSQPSVKLVTNDPLSGSFEASVMSTSPDPSISVGMSLLVSCHSEHWGSARATFTGDLVGQVSTTRVGCDDSDGRVYWSDTMPQGMTFHGASGGEFSVEIHSAVRDAGNWVVVTLQDYPGSTGRLLLENTNANPPSFADGAGEKVNGQVTADLVATDHSALARIVADITC